jgi:hypothetical protein
MHKFLDNFYCGILHWPELFQLIKVLINEIAFQLLVFAGFVTLIGLLL